LEYETVRKATAMREWALLDAGGGVVVDLVADGEGGNAEALSARKVIALRHRALVIYVKARWRGLKLPAQPRRQAFGALLALLRRMSSRLR